MKYVASVSFGKDSLAMLLLIIATKQPLDEVVFYNTGAEFKCIYDIRDKVIKELLEPNGIKYTELKPQKDFFFSMLKKEVHKRKGTIQNGYGWCGGRCRWGTTKKIEEINKYCKDCYQYIGIAYDEPKRLEKEKRPNKIFPLVNARLTEQQCLNYYRNEGWHWIEDGVDLYDVLDRVSCWCCANKNKKELRAYYRYLPNYWRKLCYLQDKINRPFNNKKTIYDYEKQFKEEK